MSQSKQNLFTGKLIRLTAAEPDDAAILTRWFNDPTFDHAAGSGYVYPIPQTRWEEWEKEFNTGLKEVEFRIRPLKEGGSRLIGYIRLSGIGWTNRSASLSIGIGDPNDQGKGYGSEAIEMILKYAFNELNLNRVSLVVYSYNAKAMRLYERLGFVEEGRKRQAVYHDGRYSDEIGMAILREEWQVAQQHKDCQGRHFTVNGKPVCPVELGSDNNLRPVCTRSGFVTCKNCSNPASYFPQFTVR